MKFQVSFKTPNVLDDAIGQFDYDPDGQCDCGGGCIDCDRLSEQASLDQIEMRQVAEKFCKYGELITVEFDTEAETATVVPVQRKV
jgi:hypothetical protein